MKLPMADLNTMSADLRGSRAKVRRDLVTGAVSLADVLADPPAVILDLTILEVLKMLRGGHSERRIWQHRLGQQALRDQVNVLVQVGRSSQATREWAVAHGQVYAHLGQRQRRALTRTKVPA